MGYNLDSIAASGSNDPAAKGLFIGDLLRHGYDARPTGNDKGQASAWFRKAALEDSESWAVSAAAIELGTCYHFGDCAPSSLESAISWYKRAGYMPVAMHLMGLAALQTNASVALETKLLAAHRF